MIRAGVVRAAIQVKGETKVGRSDRQKDPRILSWRPSFRCVSHIRKGGTATEQQGIVSIGAETASDEIAIDGWLLFDIKKYVRL